MIEFDFDTAFAALTGNKPFPWQKELYRAFVAGNIPATVTLPTGLGKTNVMAVWLIALATNPEKMPRRLVYVVNRRTVVDQSTRVAEDIREKLPKVKAVEQALWNLCAFKPTEEEKQRTPELRPLAISTLRGQFADNREWSADPSRPAVIAGTVDMIGSRLLFSGYGVGFKLKPLHAGFLGQDVLIVHDESHLEKPFQDLLEEIECEQRGGQIDGKRKCINMGSRRSDFRPMRVMALSATPRGGERPFGLTDEENTPPEVIPDGDDPVHIVWRRLRAKKTLALTPVTDEKQIVPTIFDLAWKRGEEQPGSRVIVFVRTIDAVTAIEKGLRAKKVPADNISTLTGNMRGLERSRQADPREEKADPIFARFLNPPKLGEAPWKIVPQAGTVYLICTAAGEVGVDISADHLVCDLTPFDSMAQRFGRVNRYGTGNALIDVVYEGKPNEQKKNDPFDERRWLTLRRLIDLRGDASPHAIAQLSLPDRIAAFTPTPEVMPVSDILFDTWALTTIREKLPGRPVVEPYLHGVSEGEPPETRVAWREEVNVIRHDLLDQNKPKDLLEDYPLKLHEFLQDNSRRVFVHLKKLAAADDTPVWIVSDDDTVEVTTLGELKATGIEKIEYKTVLLPPAAGGLDSGMLSDIPEPANDVADELFEENRSRRRLRVWNNDVDYEAKTEDMRLVRRINLPAGGEDEDEEGRSWHWFELPKDGDTDGSKASKLPVEWQVHTCDVTNYVTAYLSNLTLPHEMKEAIILAAMWHDLGKRRKLFQTILGNFKYPTVMLAKSGKKGGRIAELYRHEFGSLIDLQDKKQSYCDKLCQLTADMQDVVLHLIAVHHGYGRPHFPADRAFDPEPKGQKVEEIAVAVVQRFARLQRRYGRWGLAYLESLLRAADYAASANPSAFLEDEA